MASYEDAIPYIKKAEGGLSKATTDKASKNPSPYVHNGVTGWHTSRGVTWTTFNALAKSGGYQVNENNFINMPDSVWLSIYKVGFWNPMKGDSYDNQAMANAVVDFAWLSGIGEATKQLIKFLSTKGIAADGVNTIAIGFNNLVKKEGAAKAYNDLIDFRKAFLQSLNQPANTDGWLSRMETLRAQGLASIASVGKSVGNTAKKNPIGVALLIIGALTLVYTLVNRNTILA